MNGASVRKRSIQLLAILTLPLAVLAAGWGFSNPSGGPSPAPDLARGRALYERHCAGCHGPEGRGDGPAAHLLYPAPRDFGSGRFRLVSTKNGAPTQGDLIASIRRGMPGSAMPPWEWLAEEDLWNVALYVRHLSVEGQVSSLLQWAEEADEELSEPEAREIVENRMVPGELIDVGSPAPSDPAPRSGSRSSPTPSGEASTASSCAACCASSPGGGSSCSSSSAAGPSRSPRCGGRAGSSASTLSTSFPRR